MTPLGRHAKRADSIARGFATQEVKLPPKSNVPSRLAHRFGLAGALILAALAAAPAQEPPAELPLPPEIASAFRDRTPLDSDGNPIAAALEHVAFSNAEQLAAAASRHAHNRRSKLATATGEPVNDVGSYHDLLRFPEANRGRPVAVRGLVRTVSELSLPDGTALMIHLAPPAAPGGLVAVLIPSDAAAPTVGERVHAVGLFLKLAELPANDGDDPVTAPLLVTPSLTVEQASRGVLPDPSLWSVVRHRTLGVRSTESGLYYRLLKAASDADSADLRQAASEQIANRRAANRSLRDRSPFPVFVDLFQNPQAYEGEAVTLTGYAREVRKYPAGDNAEGVETLYEAWIYTDDSQSNPVVVVAPSASPDLPLGEDLQVPVRATGYFFKIYGYEAQDTTRVAPLILASHIELLPEPALDGPPWWLVTLLATAFAALITWLVASYVGVRARKRPFAVDQPSPDFTALDHEGDPQA